MTSRHRPEAVAAGQQPPENPQSLRAWAFPTDLAAQRTVQRWVGSPRIAPSFDDLAVLTWPVGDPRPSAWQARDLSGDSRLSGAFWGLLFAHLFLLPIAVGSVPLTDTDHLDDALAAIGVDAGFVDPIRNRTVPGTSALFILDRAPTSSGDLGPLADAVCLAEVQLSAAQSDRWLAGFADGWG